MKTHSVGKILVPIILCTSLAQAADELLEEVVVVGTRSAARDALDSPVPIDVISADDIEMVASLGGELGTLLQALSPAFNFPRQSNSGSADHIRSAQLRGLSSDHVLVLVNGKRQHTTAVVNLESKVGRGTNSFDFNTIPLISIKRIEILRDGAAAQYGSDAIAGVINIVLKDKSTEIGFGFLDVYKLTDRGDGISNQSWHIDEYHLSPEGIMEAWHMHFAN